MDGWWMDAECVHPLCRGEIPSVVVAAALCQSVCLTLYRSQPRGEKQARGSRRRENNCCVHFHRKHYGDVIREGGASVTYFHQNKSFFWFQHEFSLNSLCAVCLGVCVSLFKTTVEFLLWAALKGGGASWESKANRCKQTGGSQWLHICCCCCCWFLPRNRLRSGRKRSTEMHVHARVPASGWLFVHN